MTGRLATALALAAAMLLVPEPAAAASTTFDVPGTYTWVVPDGVTSATFTVVGARGGDSASSSGGKGALVVATLALVPGEELTIKVGGAGADSPAVGGGVNGGGFAGFQTCAVPPSTQFCNGGGGGGASDVRRGGADLDDRVIVAAGGGGAGGRSADGCLGDGCVPSSPRGGGDGGDAGSSGFQGLGQTLPEQGGCGGGGGTGVSGGQGGAGAGCTGPSTGTTGGQAGQGGLGGDSPGGGTGGGGGGGFFGGGGGSGGSGASGTGASGGGGGGGGSSFVTPSATGVSIATDGIADGQVSITWGSGSVGPATPAIVASTPASPADANRPRLRGTTDPGTTVTIFSTPDCRGPAAATGPASSFTGAGIEVAVADDSTTSFSALATDGSATASACSAPFTFVERTPPSFTLSGKAQQSLGARKVVVRARALNEPISFTATAKVKLPGADPSLKVVTVTVGKGRVAVLALVVPRSARERIAKAVEAGRRPVAKVKVVGRDVVGLTTVKTREVALIS